MNDVRNERIAPSSTGDDQSDMTFVALLNVVLRRRPLVVAAAFLFELLLLAYALGMPARYTALASFVPESQSQQSAASSLAAQFGVSVSTSGGMNSIQFYPELVRSPVFLAAIVNHRFAPDTASPGRPLYEIYGIEGTDPVLRRNLAIKHLSETMQMTAIARTGIVSLSVTADESWLAAALAVEILRGISDFNVHTRQSRAAAERRFVEKRLADARVDLRDAEDKLEVFLRKNADYDKSPTLAFQHSRLTRDVAFQQQLLSSLAASFEQSKIEEVRDTPVITVLRQPEAPLYPDARGRLKMLVLGIVGGLGLGVVLAVGLELFGRWRSKPDEEVLELSEHARRFREDLARGRLIRALIGSSRRK